jgi:hypothetical protein
MARRGYLPVLPPIARVHVFDLRSHFEAGPNGQYALLRELGGGGIATAYDPAR